MGEKAVSSIKAELDQAADDQLEAFIRSYCMDERQGVLRLVDTAKKRLAKLQAERERIEG